MSNKRVICAKYKFRLIILWACVFFVCSLWMYSAPVTSGRLSGVLRTDDGLNLIGITVLIGSIFINLIALIYVFRAIFLLPAISSDGELIKFFIFPFRSVVISDITSLKIGENEIEIFERNKKKKKINTSLVRDVHLFFQKIELPNYELR